MDGSGVYGEMLPSTTRDLAMLALGAVVYGVGGPALKKGIYSQAVNLGTGFRQGWENTGANGNVDPRYVAALEKMGEGLTAVLQGQGSIENLLKQYLEQNKK